MRRRGDRNKGISTRCVAANPRPACTRAAAVERTVRVAVRAETEGAREVPQPAAKTSDIAPVATPVIARRRTAIEHGQGPISPDSHR
jgi:hypothetical protein